MEGIDNRTSFLQNGILLSDSWGGVKWSSVVMCNPCELPANVPNNGTDAGILTWDGILFATTIYFSFHHSSF